MAGRVTAGVLEEIALIGAAAQEWPELIREAVAMAGILDDPDLQAVAPAACGSLMDVLARLHDAR